jgi:hypothetical protein
VSGAISGREGGCVLDARVYEFDDLVCLLFLAFLRLGARAGVGGVLERDVQVDDGLGGGGDGGFAWFGFVGVFDGDGDRDARGEADGFVEFGVVGARGRGAEGFAFGFEDVVEDEAGVGVGCCVCGALDGYPDRRKNLDWDKIWRRGGNAERSQENIHNICSIFNGSLQSLPLTSPLKMGSSRCSSACAVKLTNFLLISPYSPLSLYLMSRCRWLSSKIPFTLIFKNFLSRVQSALIATPHFVTFSSSMIRFSVGATSSCRVSRGKRARCERMMRSSHAIWIRLTFFLAEA